MRYDTYTLSQIARSHAQIFAHKAGKYEILKILPLNQSWLDCKSSRATKTDADCELKAQKLTQIVNSKRTKLVIFFYK